MSELLDHGGLAPKDVLKHLILQLHAGEAPAQVQRQLVRMMGQVPYGLVVEVEQELIEDGMPPEEVTRLCHLHGAALEGAIDLTEAPAAPPGHPAEHLGRENAALRAELDGLATALAALEAVPAGVPAGAAVVAVRARLNALTDVEKHYLRKEHLLFPYLEKHGITGPPKVMWAKHDEARALLRAALAAVEAAGRSGAPEAAAAVPRAVRPAAQAIRDMTDREENILLPMSLDTLDALEWWEIARQSADVGFCLVEPAAEWRPESIPAAPPEEAVAGGKVRLPTGSLAPRELEAILNALPLDATFVDADDRVRYFTHGRERVFARSRAVLGRKVQYCHPPSSVDTVDRILGAFRAGTRDRAAFWIQLRGRFVHIEYVALRDAAGAYLGCLEVTQDLTDKRALTGQQRLLSWDDGPVQACTPAAARAGAPEPAPGATAAPAGSAPDRPAWAAEGAVTRTHDARAALAAGEHPKARVMADLAALGAADVYVLVTPFVPGPLVDLARAQGFLAHVVTEEPAVVRTYFRRAASGDA